MLLPVFFDEINVVVFRQYYAGLAEKVSFRLAGRDPITVNSHVRGFVERISHPQRRVIEYPDASHTLEFEDDPLQYFHDLAGWCREVAEGAV